MMGRGRSRSGLAPVGAQIPGGARGSGDGEADGSSTSSRPPRRQFRSGTNPLRCTLRRTSRGKIVGHSPLLTGVMDTIDRIASSDCTVVVTGETGTGKESVVAALHDASDRAGGPLEAVNCGALPDKLIESELFGHVRGAFTDAREARLGRVAEAEGGTLFLDEISELPLSLQVKILRLLQNREYRPVGGSRTLRCDVRFVAATNCDLAEEVAKGRFRQDLYYRLDVVRIDLPPLRQRLDDLDFLADHFFRTAIETCGRDDLAGFEPDALEALRTHDWPGNIRELENVVFRSVLLAEGPGITASDVSPHLAEPTPAVELVHTIPDEGIDLRAVLRQYERALVLQAMRRTHGNKTRAAELLGLQRTSLLEMLKRLGISE